MRLRSFHSVVLRLRRESIIPVSLLGMSVASAVNAWLYELGRRTGAYFNVGFGRGGDVHHLDVLDVMLATVIVMGLGTMLFAVLKHWVPRHARTVWAIAALLAVGASFIPFIETFEASTKFWLSLMHISPVVALFIVLRMTAVDDSLHR